MDKIIGDERMIDTDKWIESARVSLDELEKEVERLREEIKDYDACLQNLWDNELIPEDTDIWDEVKELLEVD
jgi:hypothetical protein